MNTDTAWKRVYFMGVVDTLFSTMFSDLLASGARDQIQDMDLIWQGLPAHKAARQHTRAPDVVFVKAATHGGGVGYIT